MGSREERASFEAVNGLKLGLLKAKNGGVVCGMARRALLHLLLSTSPLTFQERMVIDLAIRE